jgi:PAS domain S-box-containing protein
MRLVTVHGKLHCMTIIQDISERKRALNAVAEEKERLSVTLRSIADGVITTDIKGNIVLMNKVAEELCGWPLAEAKSEPLAKVFRIINEKSRMACENPVVRVLSLGDTVELANHTILVSRDGTERVIADSGAPIRDVNNATVGVVLVFRDMTEKQKLLDNLQRADKLDSIGVLAGGIAHDFNNLLGGIFGYIDLARSTCSAESKTADYLDHALKTFTRARDLTQQLLTFSKGGAPIRKTGSVAPLLKECTQFALSGSSVSCLFHIADNLRLCDFDENQISQVVDNIVINAVQAMPLGGKLTVAAANIKIENNEISSLKQGDYIHASITDTGIGISPSIMARIFDPFFTTKQKGNGLGLATAYSIIKKHDGEITVESEPDKGTTFHLYLPVSERDTSARVVQKDHVHKGSGKILVMDDEESIRETIGAMLRMMGYDVAYALDGDDALFMIRKAAAAKEPFVAVIMDITIPGGMGGKEAIRQLRKADKDLPVFVSSGYSEDPVMADPAEYGFTDKISKPFRISELMELLARHLGDVNGADKR